ncbi:MAG: class II aldolase/adducin family protein [Thermodesulfobacteriota bacterium]
MEKDINVLKDKLARACRLLEMTGLIDYSGHISARVPGGQSFWIHPRQLSRTEVKPADMVEVTLKGESVGGGSKPPSETPIHTAVYQVRQDVNCVIHLHPHYSILPSIVGQDLIPVCQHGAVIAEASVEGAFLAACHLEENAKLFVEASILGKPIPLTVDQLKLAAGDTFTPRSIEKGWTYFIEKGRKAGIFWD